MYEVSSQILNARDLYPGPPVEVQLVSEGEARTCRSGIT